ncbi:MAG: SPOR domain-containing protein [Porticoccaceae bacterium]
MNPALRQRILGLLVLVALASVVLPLVLDFGGEARIDTQSRLPPAPDIQPTPLPEPTAVEPQTPESTNPPASRPAIDAQPQPFELAPTDAATGTSTAGALSTGAPATGIAAKSLPEEPGLDAKGLPASWVLQAGAFQDKINAQELRDRLLKGGHRAFVQTSTAGGKATHRVFVGPKMTREQLVAEQTELQRKFGVKTMIVPFVP